MRSVVQAGRGIMKRSFTLVIGILALATLAALPGPARAESIAGKVAETMNAGSYTYVLVDTGSNKVWAAANQFPVKVGDAVALSEAMAMQNFHSKALNRDFETIYFAGRAAVNGAKPGTVKLPDGHPAIGGAAGDLPAGHPAVSPKTAPAAIDFTGLKPAERGKTIEQIYAASTKLEGKPVKVRGKVVKYNANILGKNWLHIQDGTGQPGSNDLLVTSSAEARRGDTVLVEGKLTRNKDFGSGYRYEVLLEEAKVTVE